MKILKLAKEKLPNEAIYVERISKQVVHCWLVDGAEFRTFGIDRIESIEVLTET